jgi:hypothetical protein
LNQNDSVALRGVGHAAFNAGDYVKAQTYLEAAVARNETDSDSAALLEVVRLVQSSDPLAPRISSDERIRRLTADLKFSSEALKECRAQLSDNERTAALEKIEMELADDQRTRFRPASLRQEADGFRMGMNLVFRIETLTEQYCGAPSPMHRALLLIANRHGATEQ